VKGGAPLPATNDKLPMTEVPFGYREALAQVIAELAESEAKRLEAERADWRARYQGRSVLLDQRGLALAA
jgi:hypothetical protein